MQSVLNKLEHLAATTRTFIRKHWQRAIRIREKVQFSEEAFHLLLAGGVGVIGGLVNLAFHFLTNLSVAIFLQRLGDPVQAATHSGEIQRVVVPTIGGLLAGLVLYYGLRLVGRQGTTNILEVVVASDGRLPLRTSLIKAGSSLLSIGSGASIGREGAVTELAATFASKWGQWARWQPYRLRLLTACGAASGIAAAYNAPIAGAVFAALIVLGNFSMNLFAPLVFSSVIASMISRTFSSVQPMYEVPTFSFGSLIQLPWFVVLGILAGMTGSLFLKLLHWGQEMFGKMSSPVYIRVMIGGLLVGAMTVGYPEVWGNGYDVTNKILGGTLFAKFDYPLLFLLGLFAAKLLATLASVGSGAVGGVFTPTLFLGAALGSAFGMTLDAVGIHLPVTAFGLVGMGAMLAATTRAPLLAIIMILEISQNYSIMPPLMLACVISTLAARRFHPESIYTEPLRNKGLAIDRENLRPGSATEQTVGDLMRAPVSPVRETATVPEIAERFLTSPNNFLPVVDSKNTLIGLVALQDLKNYLNSGSELGAVIAYDVMRPPPPTVTPGQLLLDTLPVMLASEQRNVPVVNSRSENRLVGSVVRAEVLGLMSEAISAKWDPANPPPELSLKEDQKNGDTAKQGGNEPDQNNGIPPPKPAADKTV